MKKLFYITVLLGVFLGGYHLGRQPGSPDIIGQVQSAYGQAQELVCKTANAAGLTTSQPADG